VTPIGGVIELDGGEHWFSLAGLGAVGQFRVADSFVAVDSEGQRRGRERCVERDSRNLANGAELVYAKGMEVDP